MSKTVYLYVTHITRLSKNVASNKKGNATNPDNWETFENMAITDRENKKMLISASVVLDLVNGKVIKNRFDVPDTEIFKEYFDRYKDDITSALKQWMAMDNKNYERLKTLAQIQEPKDESNATDSN
jgi:hypothetical protein